MRTAFALFPAVVLAACMSVPPAAAPQAPVSAQAVLIALQRDLANYFAFEAQARGEDRMTHCGDRIEFHVESVTISLTTLTAVNRAGVAEAEIPIGGISLGPSGSYSAEGRSSQTVTFTVVPHGDPDGAAVVPPQPNSFDAVLRSLRETMLAVNATPPCLLFRPVEGQENTISFGFTVSRAEASGGKIEFLIFSLGAENRRRSEAAHSVTVRFNARPHAPAGSPPVAAR